MQTITSRAGVGAALAAKPIVGVVRTKDDSEAERQAEAFIAGGLALVEITFSVPGATDLVRRLLRRRPREAPPFIGMGTVTTRARAEAAVAAGAEFIVSPNTSVEVARVAQQAELYLILGALTASEIVAAHELGADLVKVFPLPPVGGAHYLSTVRQPLDDIPMLAGGGFAIEEIPAYRHAGAIAFGIGAPLVGASHGETLARVRRALELCGTQP